jgi:hypothetical protein
MKVIFMKICTAVICAVFSLLAGKSLSAQSKFSDPSPSRYFTGEGGKGLSIAILAPQVAGLAADQQYIPALVQGELVSNFSGYSAMSVLDRQRLDEQYAELLSGYYDDNAQAGQDLGKLTPNRIYHGRKHYQNRIGLRPANPDRQNRR